MTFRAFAFTATIIFVASISSPAFAVLYRYEPFNYNDAGQPLHNHTTPSGGTWLRAGAANPPNSIIVNSGNLAMPAEAAPAIGNSAQVNGIGTSSGSSVRLALAAAVTSGTVYYSLGLRIDALTGSTNVAGGFFLGFNSGTGDTATPVSAGTAKLQSRIDPTDPSKFNLGIFRNVNATAGATSWSGPLTVGETLFIVGSTQIVGGAGNDISRLWINPNPSTFFAGAAPAETLIDNSTGGTDINVASFLLRQSPAPWATIDELRIGSTWADVTPLVNPALYWDINGTTAGAGGETPSGDWTSANWNLDSGGAGTSGGQAWVDNAIAVFSGGSDATGEYTVTVSGTQIIGGLTIKNGTPTITGGTLNIAGTTAATFDSNTGRTGTVNSGITGSIGLTKTGTGALILGGTNTYSGATNVNAGRLQFANTASMPSSASVTVSSGGILGVNTGGAGEFTAASSGAGSVGDLITTATWAATGTSFGLDATTAGGTFTYADVIGNFNTGGGTTNAVSFRVLGGTVALTASNLYTGTILNGGTLEVGSDANLGDITGNINFANAATLRTTSSMSTARAVAVNAAATVDTPGGVDSTLSGAITGSSAFVKSGAGILRLTNANGYSGTSRIAAGTLHLDNTHALQNSVVNLDGADTGALAVHSSLSSVTLGGLAGSRNLTLQNAGSAAIALNIGNDVNNQPLATAAANASYSGVLSSGTGVTKVGTSRQIFTGANTYAGGTTINAGVLQFGKLVAMPASGAVTVNIGGTLAVNASAAVDEWNDGTDAGTTGTIGSLIAGRGGQGTANQITWMPGSSMGIDTTNAGTLTYAGNISGFRTTSGTTDNVGLSKFGKGTLTLTGTNTYQGTTFIGAGGTTTDASDRSVLRIETASALPANTVLSFAGTVGANTNPRNRIELAANVSVTVSDVIGGAQNAGTGTSYEDSSLIDVGLGHLTIDAAEGDTVSLSPYVRTNYQPGVEQFGTVTKDGPGTLRLLQNNTTSQFNGKWILSEGLVDIDFNSGAGGVFGSSASARLVLDGANVKNSSTGGISFGVKFIDVTGDFGFDIGGGESQFIGANSDVSTILHETNPTFTITTPNADINAATFIWRGVIEQIDLSTDRGFTKKGNGILVIANPQNQWRGQTTIQEGVLRLNQESAGTNLGHGRVGNGTGRINLAGGTFATSGVVSNGTRNIDVSNPINVTAASAISWYPVNSHGTITETNIDFTFTNDNFAADADSTGACATSAACKLTFRFDGISALNDKVFRPILRGSGFTFGGDVEINLNGIANNAQKSRVTQLVSDNASGTQTFTGNISGTGAYRRATGGTTVLTGDVTLAYQGIHSSGTGIVGDVADGVTVDSGGTLSIGNGGSTGSITSNMTNNGSLIFNRSSDSNYGGVIQGTGTVNKQGAGTLAMNGANTYSGLTTIEAGALGGSGSLVGAVTVNANAGIAPGASAGTLTVGSVTMDASSFFDIEIGGLNVGTEYDQLAVTGAATIDGALTVDLINGFAPDNGDEFRILTGSSVTGTFDFSDPDWELTYGNESGIDFVDLKFVGVSAPDGDYNNDDVFDILDYVLWRKTDEANQPGYDAWRSNYGNGSGTGNAVPEPASLALVLVAAVGWFGSAGGRRRRS